MSDDAKTWLTPAAEQKLREEYEFLTTEGRHTIEQRISEARDHGDLRENAEYDTAKLGESLEWLDGKLFLYDHFGASDLLVDRHLHLRNATLRETDA